MGKSGGKKKKTPTDSAPTSNTESPNPSVFLKRAHELKEEGNRRFQNKDFSNALKDYEEALKLIPKSHPDRAVFHSNRAACLMQMKPIDYGSVVAECSLALHSQPRFARALLRRARAHEASGRPDLALHDVESIPASDSSHPEALEMARKLRALVGPHEAHESRPSAAALGASAVGAPVSGLGPCLPARPVPKKGAKAAQPQQVGKPVENSNGPSPKPKPQFPSLALKPASAGGGGGPKPDLAKEVEKVPEGSSMVSYRPLKLVYGHDIRLSKMPVNCKFKVLREIVGTRFPSSKSVLVKYKDGDDDLVTITSTNELRLAESFVDSISSKDLELGKSESVGMLRLHVVEVGPDQEPLIPEEEESEENSSLGDSGIEKSEDKLGLSEVKSSLLSDPECKEKEMEMDDWLFEFAQMFRTHVGIDPDAHIDLHELGMELCSEALEETVTREDSQPLFEKAAFKFQEVAALAFFNWGNVHMCAARKRIPIDDSAEKGIVEEKLKLAYDWVNDKYTLAKEKYEEALKIKPDFYEGLLALGQQQFEMAKLHWSYVIAKKEDLSKWDPVKTIELFGSAEEKMKVATEMWEKLEGERAKEGKDPNMSKREEMLRKKNKQEEVSSEELVEQAAVMRSQIHLFWGNMLFERSQVECKLGFEGWREKMDAAVERFKLAGASETDISAVLKNHCSNLDEKKAENENGDVADKGAELVQASTE